MTLFLIKARASGERMTARGSKKSPSILRVVQQIDERMAAGVYVPGQRLIESDLSEELGASRGSVREALRFLAGDGVVELLPYRGAQVKPLSAARIADMLEVFGGLFRTSMELLVMRPIGAEARRDILGRVDLLRNALTLNPAQIVGGMIAYHEAIIRHTGNDYLIELTSKLHLRYYSAQLSMLRDHAFWVGECNHYVHSVEALFEGQADQAHAILEGPLRQLVRDLRNGTRLEAARLGA